VIGSSVKSATALLRVVVQHFRWDEESDELRKPKYSILRDDVLRNHACSESLIPSKGLRMEISLLKMQVRSLDEPDERMDYDKGKFAVVQIGGARVARTVFPTDWRWSTSVKPIANTKSCEAPHFLYHISGTLHIVMDDGTEKDVKAGEVSIVPPGHDKWVVGDEPVVAVDFQGMVDYRKEPSEKYGWRFIELLIHTKGGKTEAVGKALLERKEVTFVARTIGQFNIDLRTEVFVRNNSELLTLIEDVKAMDGVREVIWSEIVEVIGRKNPPYELSSNPTAKA
jgi:hypothetical protein